MTIIADFVQFPSEDFLNSCSEEQLLELSKHYDIELGDKKLKKEIKQLLRAAAC